MQVKTAWGKKIATHKKYPIYRALRARMTLRKQLKREPTKEEVDAEAKDIAGKGYTSDLTAADVMEAFGRGEEVGYYFC